VAVLGEAIAAPLPAGWFDPTQQRRGRAGVEASGGMAGCGGGAGGAGM